MTFYLIILTIIFFGFYSLLSYFKKRKKSFNFRVLTALVSGLVFGWILQITFATNLEILNNFSQLVSFFAKGYIRLLQMMVIPLILVAMTSSIMNLNDGNALSKVAPKILFVLITTVMIAGLIGIASVYVFNIDANLLVNTIGTNSEIKAQSNVLLSKQAQMTDDGIAALALSFIPTNIFNMLTGSYAAATVSTVLFSMFLGYSTLQVKQRKPEKVRAFIDFINSAKEVVLSMVREILKLTPYGVFALMTSFMMSNNIAALSQMARFIVASYAAIIVMFLIHLGILVLFGLSPIQFVKKSLLVLIFAFGSRSSMATIPLNVETQTKRLGVNDEIANMSATFGTSIGQNGCAGIYPAMAAIMAAQIAGMSIDFGFILQLVIVIAISSFGIAGVGGGATFASIAVLSIMGFDISIVAILVSIEALIDMGRTALNVSNSILAGVLTAKQNNSLNLTIYNQDIDLESKNIEQSSY